MWITDRYPPARGGMAVSCARHVRGLRRRGVRVDVVSLDAVADAAAGDVTVEARDGGDADLLVAPASEPGLASNQAWLSVLARHTAPREQRPYTHVVGFGAAAGGFHAVTFAAWLSLPATVLVRGNDLDRDWFTTNRGGLVREALSRAAAIGAVTQEKVQRLRGLFPGTHVAWTPNSVDPAMWQLLPADRQRRDEVRSLLLGSGGAAARVFGLFGELKAKKRIPFWLEALRDAQLLDRIRLLVVGTLDAATAATLDDPVIAPRSLRVPFCPPEQIAGYYAAADYVAIPSMFEGMPNVLLEAMACGCVPVVSDAGAMREVISDGGNGFLFASEDRAAAGAATNRALQQSNEEWTRMSERARAFVAEEFSPDRELDALCDLIGIRE